MCYIIDKGKAIQAALPQFVVSYLIKRQAVTIAVVGLFLFSFVNLIKQTEKSNNEYTCLNQV